MTSPSAASTDAESHEIGLRVQFGLRSDLPYVRTVDADPGSTTDRLGIPLTPEEAADITARSATVGALHAAAQDLDGFGGIWIDQAAGGVIHLAVAGSCPGRRSSACGRSCRLVSSWSSTRSR